MSPERLPVFLARRHYRRRRVADAARLLPLTGAILFCLPLVWKGSPEGASTVGAMLFVFGLWVVLVVLSAVIARHLRADETEHPARDGAAEERPDTS